MECIIKPKIIVISGTNASGKSSLGIELALKYRGEIISADSRQIYKGFDLCCGKVTSEERTKVPHHMIDVAEIGDYFSVADYQRSVYKLIPEIIARGHIPFIVGGTGLYIDSITNGYTFKNEKSELSFREMLNKKDVKELQLMLSKDAISFINTSDFNNKRRLVRIIEKEHNGIDLFDLNDPMYDTLQIGVTWPRELLYKRIDDRLKNRIQQGMIEEIRNYIESGGDINCLYKLGLEYKHIAWYIEGRYNSIDEFSTNMSIAIKQFAKKQLKWFSRNHNIHWVDMTKDYLSESCSLINEFIKDAP